mgnify:CR=1 FL=1
MGIYVVAEVGINHNGDMSICKKLIDLAASSGCDAVKFQKRDINEVYTKDFLDSHRESPWGNTQREQKEGLEFNLQEYTEIDNYCKQKSIDWFASAWDLKSQYFLQKFDLKFNKVASAMIVYDELLREIAKEGRHTFISTGMSAYKDIENAVNIFREAGCSFELMHTISTYPMDDTNANLNLINNLREKFNCDVGYSGHETGLAISYAAAALNISSLERHITLDHKMWGTDHGSSLEIHAMDLLQKRIKDVNIMLGNSEKIITESEIPIMEKLRG